jgi:DNA polymerase
MKWLSEIEQWCFEETLRMNERGMPVDIPLAKKTIVFLERYNASRIARCEEITGGISPTKVGKLLEWLQFQGVNVSSLQRIGLEKVLAEEELSYEIIEVIKIRLEQGRVSTKKLYAMVKLGGRDGRVRGSFVYHGASTGRFTARRLQPHNFQRPTIKNVEEVISLLEAGEYDTLVRQFGDRTLEAVGSCMRGFFKAPTGWLIVRGDYSAIEARVLMWLAGEMEAVELFHNNEDIYCDMASGIFGRPAEDILAEHIAEIIRGSEQRKLGKDSILGCGYSMGVLTFLMQIEKVGNDTIAGIPLRLDPKHRGMRGKEYFNPKAWVLACKAVYGYRDKYGKVPSLWADIEKAAMYALRFPDHVTSILGGKIRFKKIDHYLVMRLPSHRKIYYPYAEITTRQNPFTGYDENVIRFKFVNSKNQWVWEYTYGGKLVENAVQAIARDLMVYGMRAASEAGFKLIGTVHDEIIALHKKVRAKQRLANKFCDIICTLPDWAIGETLAETIPLTAEGKCDERYGK